MLSRLSKGVVAVKSDVENLNLPKARFECFVADLMNFTTEFLVNQFHILYVTNFIFCINQFHILY